MSHNTSARRSRRTSSNSHTVPYLHLRRVGVKRLVASIGLWVSTRPAPQMGSVGVGAGAMVGKMGGPENAAPGGVGSGSTRVGPHTVAALTVVNAVGDVISDDGTVLAGGGSGSGPRLMQNTTLSVVATDAPLSRVDLLRLARMADTALPRRIRPVNTPFDGDVTFAVSTAEETEEVEHESLLALGMGASDVLAQAIEAAVRAAGES